MPSTKKILIIDDEKDVCTALKGILNDLGYAATVLRVPEKAVATIQHEKPDLVLLDVWFHNNQENGISVLKKIRHHRPCLPVMMISGHADSTTYQQSLDLGASAILEKPFNIKNLIFEMNRCFRLYDYENMQHQFPSPPAWPFPLSPYLKHIAQSDQSIMLVGPDVLVMERLAHALHAQSPRFDQPCYSYTAHQINTINTDRLWGNEIDGKVESPGVFDHLYRGTFIVHNIHCMTSNLQKDFARVLHKKTFVRNGSLSMIDHNTRMIATTNADHMSYKIQSKLLHEFESPFVIVDPINGSESSFAQWVKILSAENAYAIDLSAEHMECIRNSAYGTSLNALQYALHALSDTMPLSVLIKNSVLDNSTNVSNINDLFHQPWAKAKRLFEESYVDYHIRQDKSMAQIARDTGINRSVLYRKRPLAKK